MKHIFRIMHQLDNRKIYAKLDPGNVLGSIESLGLQCRQAWSEAIKLKVPTSYKEVNNIVVSGMGGSALGAHIINSVFSNDWLKVPLTIINSYKAPAFVGPKTLFILSSYSGNTEEVLASLADARRKRAKLLAICAGGKLSQMASRYKFPAYVFNSQFNPSSQPRMGLGYSVSGQLALLKRCGLLKLPDKEFAGAVDKIVSWHKNFGIKNPLVKNLAKQAAVSLLGKIPVVVAAGHLSGNAHVIANQLNENSKTFSAYFLISELNHHLMEGLKFPRANARNLKFFLFNSSRYLSRIKKRFLITNRVLKKNKIEYCGYQASGSSRLAQSFEVLLFGSYVSYYLAILNNINPSLIPFVDYFKKQLK